MPAGIVAYAKHARRGGPERRGGAFGGPVWPDGVHGRDGEASGSALVRRSQRRQDFRQERVGIGDDVPLNILEEMHAAKKPETGVVVKRGHAAIQEIADSADVVFDARAGEAHARAGEPGLGGYV